MIPWWYEFIVGGDIIGNMYFDTNGKTIKSEKYDEPQGIKIYKDGETRSQDYYDDDRWEKMYG